MGSPTRVGNHHRGRSLSPRPRVTLVVSRTLSSTLKLKVKTVDSTNDSIGDTRSQSGTHFKNLLLFTMDEETDDFNNTSRVFNSTYFEQINFRNVLIVYTNSNRS